MAKAKTRKTVIKTVKKTAQVPPTEVIVPITETVIEEPINTPPAISMDQVEYEELQKVKKRYEDEAAAIAIKKADYQYFDQSFDKGSSIPAWMLPRQTEELEREVTKIGSRLKQGLIPDDEIYTVQEEYKMKKERLDKIQHSKPKLTGMQIDRLRRVKDNLESEIGDSKFTRLEMEKSLVDAHEEARRRTEPCINIDKLEAARMGIQTDDDGRVSRSKAETAWKMICSLLGDTQDNPNTEILRKDSGHSKRNLTVVDVDIKDGNIVYPEGHKYAELNA